MKPPFAFIDPGRLTDAELELVLVGTTPADPVTGFVPSYEFEMRQRGESSSVGGVRLRIGSDEELRFAGHIEYEVKRRFRGTGTPREAFASSCRSRRRMD